MISIDRVAFYRSSFFIRQVNKKNKMYTKLTKLINFIRLLTLEPIAFLTIFIFSLKRLPLDQMIQDKICLQRYNLSGEYCHQLPTMMDDPLNMKTTILADVTQFNLYSSLLITVPTFLVSVMIGPFIDKYKHAKKLLLIIASTISLLECSVQVFNSYFFSINLYYLLIANFVSCLCGGILMSLATLWSYLAAVTPVHLRALRMTIIELCIFAGSPIGTALGGNLLILQTPFVGREPRNFTAIFLAACAGAIISLLISIFIVNEKKDAQLFKLYFPTDEDLDQVKATASNKAKIETIQKTKEKSPLKILFDVQNFKDMFDTFFRPRRHNIRLQIICILFSSMTFLVAYMGPMVFLYQYVQKLYGWDSRQYSNYSTINSLINIITTLCLAPILIKVFKISDIHLSLIGYYGILFQNLLRLMSQSLWTFYAALPFYTLNSVGMIGLRNHLTKIVEREELGRIFSLMTTIDSILPLAASFIFAPLFRLTVNSIPNLAFSAVGIALTIGIVCNYVVGYQSERTLKLIAADRKRENEIEKGVESTNQQDVKSISI